jgi:hypothetical protein
MFRTEKKKQAYRASKSPLYRTDKKIAVKRMISPLEMILFLAKDVSRQQEMQSSSKSLTMNLRSSCSRERALVAKQIPGPRGDEQIQQLVKVNRSCWLCLKSPFEQFL